ncbi:heavy metal-associated isoprenylated plant protein 6-like [Parambassis ranga]|uniref:Heavy metal-associated isoprenylated plant protein 6-like n=1 Tax=Parambassis ranga TaxID=210632 RepID=A0A6P7JT63_9TELE|nr:heavy metal-associated isoprenylated plant protein 6-like [Parambassis ranga]
MANFLSGALGKDGMAKIAGEKVGGLVETTVKKALGGGEDKKKQEAQGGGGGAGGGAGGFDVGDALSFVSGSEGKEGGVDATNVIKGFLK